MNRIQTQLSFKHETSCGAQFSNSSIFKHKSVTICTRFLLSNFGKEDSPQTIFGFYQESFQFLPLIMYTAWQNMDEKQWLIGNVLGAYIY